MIHNTTPLRRFCDLLGVDREVLTKANSTGHYDFIENKITLIVGTTKWWNIVTLAHELGHALQSASEFERPLTPKNEDMVGFVVDVERDAWDKGETLIRLLYTDLPDEFWDYFTQERGRCLGNYERILTNDCLDCVVTYARYINFIFKYHKRKTPITEKYLTEIHLELSK